MDWIMWIVLLTVFLLSPMASVVLGLYVFARAREASLLALSLSLVQVHKAGMSLTPDLFVQILDHHRPSASDRRILEQFYGHQETVN